MAARVSDASDSRRPSCRASPRQHAHQGAPLRRRRKRERQIQAIGISRVGRTTKIHALTDSFGGLVAFCLTAGHVADCRAAESLLQELPHSVLVMADRAYDTNAIRQQIEQQGAVPNIPPRRTRIWKSCFSRVLYRRRNAIERMFSRLKDYRRIATRYDKLAANFTSSVYFAAAVSFWL